MAIQVVNLTDTFDEWRIKDNTTASNFGDLWAPNYGNAGAQV